MHAYERIDAPHCVYRMFDAAGDLLYIGCSMQPFKRFQHHGVTRDWSVDVVRATFEWHPDWISGRRAEMVAIAAEQPLHNRLVHDPLTVGEHTNDLRAIRDTGRVRGDGVHCPKCGTAKEKRRYTYCVACLRAYVAGRRTRSLTPPPEPLTMITDDAGIVRSYRETASALGVEFETLKMRLRRMRANHITAVTFEQLRRLSWRKPGTRQKLPPR